MAKKKTRPDRALGKIYLREWRKERGKTLAQVADYCGISVGHLSHIERGEKPYSQEIIEAAADYLLGDPTNVATLLMRDPRNKEAIWTIWDRLSEPRRNDVERVARSFAEEDERKKA